MSTNRIDHPITRRMPPPVKLRCRILALPYVQRVDLHPNGLLIVPRAEHTGGPPQRRGQREPVVARHPDQHPADRARGRRRRAACGLPTAGRRGREARRSRAAPRSPAVRRLLQARRRRPPCARREAARPRRGASSSASACPTGSQRISACTVDTADSATATTTPPVVAAADQRGRGHPAAQRVLGRAQILTAEQRPCVEEQRGAVAARRHRFGTGSGDDEGGVAGNR